MLWRRGSTAGWRDWLHSVESDIADAQWQEKVRIRDDARQNGREDKRMGKEGILCDLGRYV